MIKLKVDELFERKFQKQNQYKTNCGKNYLERENSLNRTGSFVSYSRKLPWKS